jgi:hypothetical protein
MNHRNFLEYSKTFLGVLSLLVILSCSTAVQENTAQSDIMETNKKNLGNLLALQVLSAMTKYLSA